MRCRENFTNGVLGGIVDADIDTPDVLANQPQHNENKTAHKKDGGNNRAPAHFDSGIDQFSDYHIEAVTEAKECKGCSAQGGDSKRLDGKSGKAVEPEAYQLFKGIAGLADHAVVVCDRDIVNVFGGTKNQTLNIGIGILITQNLIQNKAPHNKVACNS